jgi:hypothetical protein
MMLSSMNWRMKISTIRFVSFSTNLPKKLNLIDLQLQQDRKEAWHEYELEHQIGKFDEVLKM